MNSTLKFFSTFILVSMLQPRAYAHANKQPQSYDIKSDLKEARFSYLLAQRKKSINASGKLKRKKDKTTIDFDEIDISGSRRLPLGTMVNQGQVDTDYSLVRIRLRWHPEMIRSAKSLETKIQRD